VALLVGWSLQLHGCSFCWAGMVLVCVTADLGRRAGWEGAGFVACHCSLSGQIFQLSPLTTDTEYCKGCTFLENLSAKERCCARDGGQ
jgi:hypothetical protein